jgi:hypothetical protein
MENLLDIDIPNDFNCILIAIFSDVVRESFQEGSSFVFNLL